MFTPFQQPTSFQAKSPMPTMRGCGGIARRRAPLIVCDQAAISSEIESKPLWPPIGGPVPAPTDTRMSDHRDGDGSILSGRCGARAGTVQSLGGWRRNRYNRPCPCRRCTVDGSGFYGGPAALMRFPPVACHCGNGVIPPISGHPPRGPFKGMTPHPK
jgi:hypothetical protein